MIEVLRHPYLECDPFFFAQGSATIDKRFGFVSRLGDVVMCGNGIAIQMQDNRMRG